jgi:hypothetical protein
LPGRRTFFKAGGAVAAGAIAATAGVSTPAQAATAVTEGHLGLSVKDFGAVGDRTTDDTAAIQNALNTATPGDIVFLPVGEYATSAPLVVPPGVTLMGTHGNHIDEGDATFVPTGSRIIPLATFKGAACIMIVNKTTGGYAADSAEQRLFTLTLNGSRLAAGSGVDGIQFYGKIHGVIVRDVSIFQFPNHGIWATYGTETSGPKSLYSSRFERVAVKASGGIGYSFNNTTDSQFTDLESIQAGGDGFFISGCGNSCFTNCRAEWSSFHGFEVQGSTGIVELLGCSTDRNNWNGVVVNSGTVDGVVLLNGLRLNRDGKNGTSGGGGYAGLRITGAKTAILVTALAVETGLDDGGGGTRSPQWGVNVDSSACAVIDSGIVRGVSGGVHDGGTNTKLLIGATVVQRT